MQMIIPHPWYTTDADAAAALLASIARRRRDAEDGRVRHHRREGLLRGSGRRVAKELHR
jgi:hypothetical protein